MVDERIPESTPMKDFYRDKTIFLYVEKLLRCRAKKIYLLTRPKKNQSPLERIQETFSGDLFKILQSKDKNYMSKISLVEGDLGSLKLGISPSKTEELVNNVEIVLHAAAEVRFDKTLQELSLSNVRGTREIIALAKEIKNLLVFAYISTAYSHCPNDVIEEKFYQSPMDPNQMIRLAEYYKENDSDVFNTVTSFIINPWGNTYVFTKALTEDLVRQAAASIPTVVIRPSISEYIIVGEGRMPFVEIMRVIATHEDPIPAWCNNTYGLNGVLVAVGLGFMRIIQYSSKTESNIVCADFVTNATFAAIWNKANERLNTNEQSRIDEDNSGIIYHITAKEDNLTWHEINKIMTDMFLEYPSCNALWLHRPNNTSCPFLFSLLTILYHAIPGYLFDIYLALTKNKFRMSKDDQEFFPCDVNRYDFKEYSYKYLWGLRTYISREPIDNIDAARKKLVKLKIAHYFVLVLYYSFVLCFYYYFFKLIGVNNFVRGIYKSFASKFM